MRTSTRRVSRDGMRITSPVLTQRGHGVASQHQRFSRLDNVGKVWRLEVRLCRHLGARLDDGRPPFLKAERCVGHVNGPSLFANHDRDLGRLLFVGQLGCKTIPETIPAIIGADIFAELVQGLEELEVYDTLVHGGGEGWRREAQIGKGIDEVRWLRLRIARRRRAGCCLVLRCERVGLAGFLGNHIGIQGGEV